MAEEKNLFSKAIDWIDNKLDNMGAVGTAIQIADPTGITGYKDVEESYQNFKKDSSLTNAGLLGLATLGALPMIGKIPKLLSKSKKLGKELALSKELNKSIDATKLATPNTFKENITLIKEADNPEKLVSMTSLFPQELKSTSSKAQSLLPRFLLRTKIEGLSDLSEKLLTVWRKEFNESLGELPSHINNLLKENPTKYRSLVQSALNKADGKLVDYIKSELVSTKGKILKKDVDRILKSFKLELRNAFEEFETSRLRKANIEVDTLDKQKYYAKRLTDMNKTLSRFPRIIDYKVPTDYGYISKKRMKGYSPVLSPQNNTQTNIDSYALFKGKGRPVTQNVVRDDIIVDAAARLANNPNIYLPQAIRFPAMEYLLGQQGPVVVKTALRDKWDDFIKRAVAAQEQNIGKKYQGHYFRLGRHNGLKDVDFDDPRLLDDDNYNYYIDLLYDYLKSGGKLSKIKQFKQGGLINNLNKPKTWEEYQKQNRNDKRKVLEKR